MFNQLEKHVLSFRLTVQEIQSWESSPPSYSRKALQGLYEPEKALLDCIQVIMNVEAKFIDFGKIDALFDKSWAEAKYQLLLHKVPKMTDDMFLLLSSYDKHHEVMPGELSKLFSRLLRTSTSPSETFDRTQSVHQLHTLWALLSAGIENRMDSSDTKTALLSPFLKMLASEYPKVVEEDKVRGKSLLYRESSCNMGTLSDS